MSLVNIYFTDKSALILTDSVSSNENLMATRFSIKCDIISHYHCVICTLGCTRSTRNFTNFMRTTSVMPNFDTMLAELCKEVPRFAIEGEYIVYIIGYSDDEEKLIIREFNSRTGRYGLPPESNIILHPRKKLLPEDTQFLLEYKPEEDMNYKALFPKFKDFCLLQKEKEDNSLNDTRIVIGGDLVLTYIDLDEIITQKVHRFADKSDSSIEMLRCYYKYQEEQRKRKYNTQIEYYI